LMGLLIGSVLGIVIANLTHNQQKKKQRTYDRNNYPFYTPKENSGEACQNSEKSREQ